MSDSLNPTSDAEQLMLGAIPGKPALGRGPAVDGDYSRHPYHHPAAGWGAAESVAGVLARAGELAQVLSVHDEVREVRDFKEQLSDAWHRLP